MRSNYRRRRVASVTRGNDRPADRASAAVSRFMTQPTVKRHLKPGVRIQPTGLLQRHDTTRSTREADETPAVGAERCRADDNQCTAA